MLESTDVYSLGVLLYELIAGRRPYEFKTRSPQEIVSVICENEPVKPSVASQQPDLKGDLDSIVAMALRKDSQFRYRSVSQLAADISRYLEGQPVRAVRPTIRYRVLKFLRRRSAAVGSAMILPVLAALMLWHPLQRQTRLR